MYTISQLFIYPVKSLGGFEVTSAELTDRGFQYDRRFMLVDSSNHFLTQRKHAVMSLLQTAIEGNNLIIFHKNNTADKVKVPLQPTSVATTNVQVWDDTCEAQYVSDLADEWLSDKLSIKCRLVYMPDSEMRLVDERYANNKEITSFSDGYPLLLIGQASLDDLNNRLAEPLSMDRFRPNVVFTGGVPYVEDTMEHILINEIEMFGVKLCARCVVTTINQATGKKANEPLKTLAGYRMKDNNIFFGQNILFKQTGIVKVGEALKIISAKSPLLTDI